MAGKKTILLPNPKDEQSKDMDKKPLNYYLRSRKGGIGGTIGSMEREGKPNLELKWKAGLVKGTPGAQKKRSNRLHKKALPGFRIEVKF